MKYTLEVMQHTHMRSVTYSSPSYLFSFPLALSHFLTPSQPSSLLLTPLPPFTPRPSLSSSDVNMERRKSLQGLVDLRMETIPLVESEEENAAQDQLGDNHKYLLFKNPSGEAEAEHRKRGGRGRGRSICVCVECMIVEQWS